MNKALTLPALIALLSLGACSFDSSPGAYAASAQAPSAEPGSGMPPLPPGCLEGRLKGYQVTRPDADAGVPGITC